MGANMRAWVAGVMVVAAASFWAGCSDDGGGGAAQFSSMSNTTAADAGDTSSADSGGQSDAAQGDDAGEVVEAPFKALGTLEQVYVWMAPAEEELELVNAAGDVLASGTTDMWGSLILRELEPAADLTVRRKADPSMKVDGIEVKGLDDLPPDPALYDSQVLEPGNNYITTRDGTKLHVFVSLPGPPEDGPYPTLVNYSGYSPGRPGEKTFGDLVDPFCDDFPVLCDMPSHGAGIFGGLFGYATVGVNMRGTGCSGGAYDFFEPLQLMDGYDAVEVVARQPWVKHNKVGMAGLSYPGLSQLFVARTQPPSLAAITPMSVVANTSASTLAPGGIFNDGFALSWIENVLERAQPYGHRWIQEVIDGGDAQCEEHQLLHGQLVNVVDKALANPFYTDEVALPLDPSAWADEITVPLYLTGQWQDEQTGPHFATLLDRFTGSPVTRFTVTNGVHVDGFSPNALMEWKIFLDLYVAREVPSVSSELRPLAPLFFSQFTGAALDLPPNRFEDYTDFDQALADYEAEPDLQVIWESGASEATPGAPEGAFETYHDAWPAPSTEATRWYFHPDGSLSPEPPGEDGGASQFNHDPGAGGRTTLPGGGVSDLLPDWDYRPLGVGKAVAFITAPLEEDVVTLGHGSVDLWLRSTATDADLEVTLTEVRPDGQEMLVQSGWLRASHRALAPDATELRPAKTHREGDHAPLTPGEWVEARVEIMPFGHIFRAGSRIRVSVDTPGDSMARWYFILLDHDEEVVHTIGHDLARPSSVALPVLPDVQVPTALPACPSLRGQPCRDYVPLENTPASD